MTNYSRRSALTSVIAAGILSACSDSASRHDVTKTSRSSTVAPKSSFAAKAKPEPSATKSASAPPRFAQVEARNTIQNSVPPANRQFALTIDDGTSYEDVKGYVDLCKSTGIRLTFFANGSRYSWYQVAKELRPLVDSGQIVIGNHTFSHPDMRFLSAREIAAEMRQNEKVFHNLYGIDMKPFMRPPYGSYTAETQKILQDLGYGTICLWYGTLGDDQNISVSAEKKNAIEWIKPGHMTIGHANHPNTLHSYDTIHHLIESQKLTTVTVKDVFRV